MLLKNHPQLTKKTAIIFDMDGVLIDSEALHERASREAFASFGLNVPDELYGDFKGKTDRNVVEHVLQVYSQPSSLIEEVLQAKRHNYASYAGELRMIEGALDLLNRVSVTHRVALTTSASRRNQELAFGKFNLTHFFEVVTTSNDITRPKPHPEPYEVTVQKMNLLPSDCIVFEDSTNGVRSAVGAGCTVVGITTSFGEAALREAGAHVVIDGYAGV